MTLEAINLVLNSIMVCVVAVIECHLLVMGKRKGK